MPSWIYPKKLTKQNSKQKASLGTFHHHMNDRELLHVHEHNIQPFHPAVSPGNGFFLHHGLACQITLCELPLWISWLVIRCSLIRSRRGTDLSSFFLFRFFQLSSSRDFSKRSLEVGNKCFFITWESLRHSSEELYGSTGMVRQFPLCPNEQGDHSFVSFTFGRGL